MNQAYSTFVETHTTHTCHTTKLFFLWQMWTFQTDDNGISMYAMKMTFCDAAGVPPSCHRYLSPCQSRGPWQPQPQWKSKMMMVRMIIWVAFIFWIKSFFDSAPWVRFQSEARRSWHGFEKYKALLQEQKYQKDSVFVQWRIQSSQVKVEVEYRSTTGRWFHSHSQKL